MRVLWLSLAFNPADPVLGFASKWVDEVAARVTAVDVLTLRVGPSTLAPNVRVFPVARGLGDSRVRRAATFYSTLWRLLRENRYDACFSHMNPLFSLLAGPLLRAHDIPLFTWYAHPSNTMKLRAAHRLSTAMITSVASAYPYRSDKVIAIGQGIDTSIFSYADAPGNEVPLILCAGRVSRSKDHLTLIKAIERLHRVHGCALKVVIAGPVLDVDYRETLAVEIAKRGLQEVVSFAPAQSQNDLARWYHRCDAHVNLTPTGFGDKVAWEAMACGRPSIVANHGYAATLGQYRNLLMFDYQDDEQLADRLLQVIQLPVHERNTIGRFLSNQVNALHALPLLARRIVAICESKSLSAARASVTAPQSVGIA